MKLRDTVLELLTHVSPLLIPILVMANIRIQSSWLGLVAIALGALLYAQEDKLKRATQEQIDEAKRAYLGERPSLGRKVAGYFLVMRNPVHKHYAVAKVMIFVGVFFGMTMLLEYW